MRWLLLPLLLAGCTLAEGPTPPPVVTPPVERVVFLPGVREEAPWCLILPSLPYYLGPDLCPKVIKVVEVTAMRAPHSGEALRVPAMTAEPLEALPVRLPPPLKPDALIRAAHKAALVPPTERCYFGGSNMCRYAWVPNKIYPIYVSPASETKIALPPGERLANSLSLDGKLWDVGTARVGTEPLGQDIIFVRAASMETPTIDIALVSESGHSFDIQLIVAKQGMFGVTWEVPPIVHVPAEEDTPLFAKPVR